MSVDDRVGLALARLDDIRHFVAILAAGADEQNAWLHPCGWTRDEPYVHISDHPPCMPMGEFYDMFEDMWPAWRTVLEPVLTPALDTALGELTSCLATFFAVPYDDETATLDSDDWAAVRQCASRILPRFTAAYE